MLDNWTKIAGLEEWLRDQIYSTRQSMTEPVPW